MPLRFRIAGCVIFTVLVSCLATAQSLTPQQISAIDNAAAEFLKANNVPAVSIAVGLDGKIGFSKGYGMADVEQQVPTTPKTRFRTGSIAKPMTAVGAMELVDKHKLDLDAPVQQYCPAFPKKQWTVTTKELLAHRAGVHHYLSEQQAANTKHFGSLTDSISGIFGNDDLLFEPGTNMSYTTYGYVVVGCAIEGASGVSYSKYMADNVFGPAGMVNTAVDDNSVLLSNRVHFYEHTSGTLINAPYFDSSDRIPGGGFVSTPEDLVRFAFAVQSGKLVSAELVKQMWTPLSTRPNGSGYGLGWGMPTSTNGRKLISHGGGQVGTTTVLTLAPDDHIAYAIMTNVSGIDLGTLQKAVEQTIFPTKAAMK